MTAEWGSVPKTDEFDRADINAISKATDMADGRHVVAHTGHQGEYDIGVLIDGQGIKVTFDLGDKKRRLGATWSMQEVRFGERAMFICPKCGKTCTHLYPIPGGCKACCGIRHRQKGKRWPKPESMETVAQIEKLLGWKTGTGGSPKPKGMSEAKYQAFIERCNELARAEYKANQEEEAARARQLAEDEARARRMAGEDRRIPIRQERQYNIYGERIDKPYKPGRSAAWDSSGKQIR